MATPFVGSFAQTARQTTGADPFSAALSGSLPKPAPAIGAQVAKNTTGYPSYPSTAPNSSGPTSKPAAPGASAPTKPAAPASGSGQSIYDLSTDPIVQKIQQLNTANYGQAVAGAQAGAKQDIVNSGFDLATAIKANPELAAAIASSPVGSVLTDPATAAAASANPFSTAATLANTHTGNVNTINQGDNDNNLFYGSAHANHLADEDKNYLGSVAGAQGNLSQALTTILQGLTGEKETEQQNLANTIETERENTITNALKSGEVMLGYDSNGNPIFRNTGVTGTTPSKAAAKPAPKPAPRAGQTARNSY